jgi:hypothetical protein
MGTIKNPTPNEQPKQPVTPPKTYPIRRSIDPNEGGD